MRASVKLKRVFSCVETIFELLLQFLTFPMILHFLIYTPRTPIHVKKLTSPGSHPNFFGILDTTRDLWYILSYA